MCIRDRLGIPKWAEKLVTFVIGRGRYRIAGGGAVSYTHLDVYKRQNQTIALILNERG